MARTPTLRRPRIENSWIKLRSSAELLRAVTEHAHSQQLSLSKYVRMVLVERLAADGVIVRDGVRVPGRPRIVRDEGRALA
jgi:hypothetical protein